MRSIKTSILLLMLVLCTNASAVVIDVYTNTDSYSTSIDGVDVKYHKVNEILDIEASLDQGLPNNKDQARRRLANKVTPQIEQSIIAAWATVTKVKYLRVKYLPAIVFDGKYVYYGHDLRRAKNLYDGAVGAGQ